MGSWFSSDSNWRDPGQRKWTEEVEEELFRSIKRLDESRNRKVTKAHVLLCGPNKAGKSSFMNSVIGACEGRQVHISQAGQSEAEEITFTKTYITRAAPNAFNTFRLSDAPGLLEPANTGLHVMDVVALLEGHVKKGYTFKFEKPIDAEDEFYVLNPTKEENVHCVVFVYDSQQLESYTEKYMCKIREITKTLHAKEMPYCMILTKIDLLDPDVGTNIKKIHESTIVKKAVECASKKFGVEERSIFPVVNFVKHPDIKPLTTIPHLIAMRTVINFANDFLEAHNA